MDRLQATLGAIVILAGIFLILAVAAFFADRWDRKRDEPEPIQMVTPKMARQVSRKNYR